MSTSPEPSPRADDEIVSALSHWLAYHLGNAELLARLRAVDTADLSRDQAAAVHELVAELGEAQEGTRGTLEMHVRETLEAVALG